MPLLPEAKNCDISVKKNFQLVSNKLGYTAVPPFAGITLTGLTASALIGADTNKLLESVTIGSSLDYTRPTLDTIQDIQTTATPQFAGLGVNVAADPDIAIQFYNDAVETTNAYYGISNFFIKSAGVTGVNDGIDGILNLVVYDQSGGVEGWCWGIENVFQHADGDIGDGSNDRAMYAIDNTLDLNGGKVYGDVYGCNVLIDQEGSHEVTGDIYGNYISIDADGTVGGSVYGLYLKELSNVDYGIYQSGTADNVLGGTVQSLGLTIPDCCVFGANDVLFRPTANSETFFKIQEAGNGSIVIFNVNTTGRAVELGGKITAGSFASPVEVTSVRKYGCELHYAGLNYDVTGLRSRARLKTTDASTRTAQGALLQAANEDGIDAGVLNGALIEAIGKSDSTASTISMMRGCLVNTEWYAKETVTDLRVLHVRTHTRDAATEGYVSGTGYGIYIENEAVGGNGQALDAGIYFKGTNLSAGNKAFTYGIDFSGGTFASEEIKLANGSVIGSDKVTFQPTTDSTNFFQIKDAAGAIVGNFDTVNKRWGNGTASPTGAFEIMRSGEIAGFYFTCYRNGSGTKGLFYSRSARGSSGSPLTIRDGDEMFRIIATGYDGTDFGGTLGIRSAEIVILADGTVSNNDIPARIDFRTNSGTLTGVPQIRMTIRASGNIGFIEEDPETLIELSHPIPTITGHCTTHTDSADARAITFQAFGEQSGGEETTLGKWVFAHDSADDDEKAYWKLFINTGSDGDTPTQALEIGSDLLATFAGVVTTDENYQVDGTQVVSNQGAAVADAADAATTMARLNDLLARCRAHGLIAS